MKELLTNKIKESEQFIRHEIRTAKEAIWKDISILKNNLKENKDNIDNIMVSVEALKEVKKND